MAGALRRRALVFSFSILPFMLNIALIDFLIPVKYDLVLENLPLIGFLISLAWLSSSFLDFAVGDLTDRIGVKRTLQIGVVLSFVGSLVFALSSNFLIMTFGIFIWGLSYIMITVPSDTYILSKFPRNYRGSAYGIMYFLYDLAYAVAPLLGYFVITYFGMNAMIVSAAVISLFTLPLLFVVRGKAREDVVDGVEDVIVKDGIIKKELKDLFKMDRKELSLLFNMFICGAWFMTVLIGAPLLFFHEERNLFDGALLAFAFMIPFAMFELLYGKLSDSAKNRKVMVNLGFVASAVLLVVFYFTHNFILLLVLAFLITLFANMAWVASEVHVSEYLPKGRKGEFMGIFVAGKDIGLDIAPLFYGLLAAFGLKVPFLVLGVLLFLAWLFFVIAWRKG